MDCSDPGDGAAKPRAAVAGAPPDVSIITPCFNAAETIAETVESVLAQTHTRWELICVDDGSTDATPTLLAEFAGRDPRIRVIKNDGSGAGAARNRGLRLARGEHVIFLDADDIAYPEALRVLLVSSRAVGGDAIIAPGYELLNHDARPLARFRFADMADVSVETLLCGNRFPPMSMAPASALPADPIDETLKGCIDWDFWLRLVQTKLRCVGLRRVLFGYRLRKGSLSHSADRMFAAARRLVERWAPRANDPAAARDALHRFACNYGALALASGSPDAIDRYFAELPSIELNDACLRAMAWHIRGAFDFVHGADGRTWDDCSGVWIEGIEPWLRGGPLSQHADAILTHLRQIPPDRRIPIDAVREFVAQRPGVRNILVYGLGRNGVTLLEHMRRDELFGKAALHIADDYADELTFDVQELPRDDPRKWSTWPRSTIVIVTPNECEPMRRTLERAGGHEGEDFLLPFSVYQIPTDADRQSRAAVPQVASGLRARREECSVGALHPT